MSEKTALEEYREIFKSKIEHYGLTNASIDFAIETILAKEQEVRDMKTIIIDGSIKSVERKINDYEKTHSVTVVGTAITQAQLVVIIQIYPLPKQ